MHLTPVPLFLGQEDVCITCVDTWENDDTLKLVLGTKSHGVLVFTLNINDGYRYTEKVVHSQITHGTPVKQLRVFDSKNQMAVLSSGLVCIHFLSIQTIYHYTTIELQVNMFSVCKDSIDPIIALATRDYIYISTWPFYRIPVAKIPIADPVIDMVLMSSQIFIMSDIQSQAVLTNIKLSSNRLTQWVNMSAINPIVRHFTNNSILFHIDTASTVLESSESRKLFWQGEIQNMAVLKTHCIGTNAHSIEVLDLGSEKSHRLDVTWNEQLQFITDKAFTFLATSKSVWHLTIPGSRPIPLEPWSAMIIAPAITFTLADANRFWRSSAEVKAEEVVLPNNFSPDSPLSILHINVEVIESLAQNGITSVGSFSEIPDETISSYYGPDLLAAVKVAKGLMQKYRISNVAMETTEPPVISPEDPLEVIGLSATQIGFLGSLLIFTVRQFANLPQKDVEIYSEELVQKHAKANEVLWGAQQKITTNPTVYCSGFMYLSTSEFAHVVENRCVKSPYVLFHEYVECEPETKENHPWKDVYARYCDEILSISHFKTHASLSDADVFAYLCWKGAATIGKLDTSAGNRAFQFYLQKRIIAPNDYCVQINVTSLINNHGGKVFLKQKDTWSALKIEQLQKLIAEKAVDESDHPCGYIVIPSGCINWDCMTPHSSADLY